jgi:16S rRNA (uracil1498-N3)-methyltransferase
MSRRRFFAARLEGGAACLEGDDARHLERVLRAVPGQEFELAWRGRLFLARLRRISAGEAAFDVIAELPAPPPAPALDLAVALFKFDRFEWMLEKATELGLTRLHLLATRHVDPRLLAAAPKRMERWAAIVHAAAEQSRRLDHPTILPPRPLADFLASSSAASGDCERWLLSESPGGEPLPVAHAPRLLLAGPEGGWSSGERDAALAAGFLPASLGSRILRCETALIAALARSSI